MPTGQQPLSTMAGGGSAEATDNRRRIANGKRHPGNTYKQRTFVHIRERQ